MLFLDIVGLVQDYNRDISSVSKMEGGSGPKLAKFESQSSGISGKMYNLQQQLAEIEEHCKLFKSSLNSTTSKNTEAIKKEEREKTDEMQMSSYTGRPIQDYYCITQGVWERDGVSDANRHAEEFPPKVHIISPSSSSSDDATSLTEKSEKLTLFINPLSDIGERGSSEDNLVKTCEWEVGRRRSEILRKSEDYLCASAMAEEGDSAIGTPHPYMQRTTSFTFPDFYSPDESCELFQTSREKASFPLESQMGKVHVRVSNSDSQGEDFWEFDTCTSDLGSVSMGTSPSSADSHSPHFGNSTVAFRKSPLNVMTSLGQSKSDRFLNVENWSLEPNSRTSSTSVDQSFDLKEMKSGESSQREITPQKSPEMTVFPDQKIELDEGRKFRESTPLVNHKINVESDPCTEEDMSSDNGEQLTLYVPVVSSDSENIEEHESVILSISPSDKSEKNEILHRPTKKTWHQCVKDVILNAVKSIFCAAEEDHDLEDLDMQTVRYKPEGLDTLCRATKFNRKELQLMYRGFKQECPSGVVNEETFKNIYSQFFPQGDSSRYAHFVFNSFDTDHNGSLTFEEFVSGLSILARGTVNEKLNWAFNLYDINGDGYITREEMLSVVQAIYDMMGKYSEPTAEDITPGEHVERVFQKMDINRDGVVSIEEFIDCCKKDETITRSMHVFDTIL